MQPAPHAGVAALAEPVAAAVTPPTIVSAATAATAFLLIESTWMDDEPMRLFLSRSVTDLSFDATQPPRLAPATRPSNTPARSPACRRVPWPRVALCRGKGSIQRQPVAAVIPGGPE